DVGKLKPNAQGYYELHVVVPLMPKNNRLRVEAVNEGGEQRAAVVVNYVPMPVRLNVDRLELAGQEDQAIEPKSLADGKLSFAAAPGGRLTLKGRITWAKEND